MTIQSNGKNSKKANELAMHKILELEHLISTTDSSSEIFTLNEKSSNAADSTDFELSMESAELVAFSLGIARETDGALNPCLYPVIKEWGFTTGKYKVPDDKRLLELLSFTDFTKVELDLKKQHIRLPAKMNIDFGAVGKGYAGDKAVETLRQCGISSAILDLGGNVQALGPKADGTPWRVGIKNPATGNPFAALSVVDRAVVTSGGYERYFTDDDGSIYIHIFDGKTGRPVQSTLLSASIICESGLYADSLSTAMFVLGVEKACDFWREKNDFEMVLLTDDGEILYTDGIKGRLELLEDFSEITIVK